MLKVAHAEGYPKLPVSDYAHHPKYKRYRAFRRAVEVSTGQSPELVPLAVTFGKSGCDHRGLCLTGCSVHGKNSLDTNYLKVARERFKVKVEPLREAFCIERLQPEGYRVHVRHVGRRGTSSITAKRVVIAAGCLGSTELLLRCKVEHKTLPDLSEQLGNSFSTNGDYLYAGAAVSEEIHPTQGLAITAGFRRSTGIRHILIEDIGISDYFKILLAATASKKPRKLQTFRRLLGGAPAPRRQPSKLSEWVSGDSFCLSSQWVPTVAMEQ